MQPQKYIRMNQVVLNDGVLLLLSSLSVCLYNLIIFLYSMTVKHRFYHVSFFKLLVPEVNVEGG